RSITQSLVRACAVTDEYTRPVLDDSVPLANVMPPMAETMAMDLRSESSDDSETEAERGSKRDETANADLSRPTLDDVSHGGSHGDSLPAQTKSLAATVEDRSSRLACSFRLSPQPVEAYRRLKRAIAAAGALLVSAPLSASG